MYNYIIKSMYEGIESHWWFISFNAMQ